MNLSSSGNEVDRMFSVLAKLFKESEMRCINDLVQTIQTSPIVPSPMVVNMFYSFDWKTFIQSKFAKAPLEHHSFYHSFKISKEEGKTKFQGKLYPQDQEYGPVSGIQLLKEGVEFSPVGPTVFRIEKLELERVFRSLTGYLPSLPLEERMRVSSSWHALRKTLESLPKQRDNLMKMDIRELPRQSADAIPALPEHFARVVQETEVPQLRGQIIPEEVTEGDFDTEIVEGSDVVVYTKSKTNRPWLGRILRILPEGKFIMHWYQRRSRGNTFYAMVKPDGSPVLSEQTNEVVMGWHISEDGTRKENSFQLSYYTMEKINQDYLDHDVMYE